MRTIQISDVELAEKLADLRQRVEVVDATGRVVAWFDPNRGGEQKPILVEAKPGK